MSIYSSNRLPHEAVSAYKAFEKPKKSDLIPQTYSELRTYLNSKNLSNIGPKPPSSLEELLSEFYNHARSTFLQKYRPGYTGATPVQTLFYPGESNNFFSSIPAPTQNLFMRVKQILQPSFDRQGKPLEYYDWLDFTENGILEQGRKASEAVAQNLKAQGIKNAVVMGMGGSSMCGKLIDSALETNAGGIGITTLDNMDPQAVLSKIKTIKKKDLASTAFVIISKSGNTFEVSHVLESILNHFQENFGREEGLKKFAKNAVFVTEPKEYNYQSKEGEKQGKNSGTLNNLIDELNSKGLSPNVIAHPPRVGGRFSLFSPVGLFITALKGRDSKAFLAGAKQCADEFFKAQKIQDSPAAMYAFYDLMSARNNFRGRYVMPYSDSLSKLPEFTAQLAGESNCKNGVDALDQLSGRAPTAHHSDIEALCRNDRSFLVEEILVNNPEQDHITGVSGLKTLQGNQLKSLHTETMTKLALPFGRHVNERKGNPLITTVVDKLDEKALGYLAMRYMLSTVIQAGLQKEDGQVTVGVGDKANSVNRTLQVNLMRAVTQDEVETMKIQKAKDASELGLNDVEFTPKVVVA